MNKLTEVQLALLGKADSPTVANVIELFEAQSRVVGYSNATLKAIYPSLPPAVGYAVTATFRSAYPATTWKAADGAKAGYGGMPQLIEDGMGIPEPRIIVFQDLDEPAISATYGEMMVTAFQTFGFVGLITSGAARDIEQVRALNFPCWASGTIVSHGYNHFLASNVPVNVGGLSVQPGDLIHADANGVVNIPHTIAPMVADLCAPYMEAENLILNYLHQPNATLEGYKNATADMRDVMGRLRTQAQDYLKGVA